MSEHWITLSLTKLSIKTTSHFFIWHGLELNFNPIFNLLLRLLVTLRVTLSSWYLYKMFHNSLVIKLNCTGWAEPLDVWSNINLVKGIFRSSGRLGKQRRWGGERWDNAGDKAVPVRGGVINHVGGISTSTKTSDVQTETTDFLIVEGFPWGREYQGCRHATFPSSIISSLKCTRNGAAVSFCWKCKTSLKIKVSRAFDLQNSAF